MRKTFLTIISCLALPSLLVSCLSSDDTTYDATSDALISAFSISDIETSVASVTDEGNDTTLTVTTTGSDYAFVINQSDNTIYNNDSLPAGTDVTKVVVSLSITGYAVVYEKNNADTLWTSTDSINFTNPVKFKVYAYDGTTRTYTAKINVHQAAPDSMQWNELTGSDYAIERGVASKALAHNGKIYVFADGSEQVSVTSTATTDGRSWSTPQAVSGVTGKADYRSVIVYNDQFYMLAQNKLYISTDALNWSAVGTNQTFSQLIATGKQYHSDESLAECLYGISNTTNHFVTTEDGSNWSELETEATNFPTTPVFSEEYALPSNSRIHRQLVIGTSTTDSIAQIWSKLSTEKEWTNSVHSLDNLYGCPRLKDLAIIRYNGYLYAFGGVKQFTTTEEVSAFGAIYRSIDNGIVWRQVTSGFTLPEEFADRTESFSYVVTPDHCVWIMWSDSREVWRGYMNRLVGKQ